MKIALTCIIKDDSEVQMYERMLTSFAPYVEGIYCAVTGPSGEHEKIIELTKKFGGKALSINPDSHPQVYAEIDGKMAFAHFAEARNVSFDLVDDEYDWLLWADVDDMLLGGDQLRETAEKALKSKVDAVQFAYWYAVQLDEKGEVRNILIEHMRERLLRPNKFKWISRLHEVATAKDTAYKPVYASFDYDPDKKQEVAWIHLPEDNRMEKISKRNNDILDILIEETKGKDPRPLFYRAKTAFDEDDHDMVISLISKYLKMSGWDAERSNALDYLGQTLGKMGKFPDAIEVFHQAIFEFPTSVMPYLRLSDCYYNLEHKEFADHWLEIASNMREPKAGQTIGNTFEINLMFYILRYNQAIRNNDVEGTVKWTSLIADMKDEPDFEPYHQALWNRDINIASKGLFNLLKWLNDNQHKSSIEPIINALPQVIREQEFMSMVANKVLDPKKWDKGSIVYFASFGQPAFEKWTPDSLKTGLGGSETAVIQLSKEWAKTRPVTVYCDCGEGAGVYDGVEYKDYRMFNWNDEFDTLILWRSPHLLDQDIKAKNLWMDLHDIISPLDWPEGRMSKIDKVFFKSQMHREYLPDLPDKKAVVISNGMD